MTKCNTCGRQCWTCKACNNRTYCEFCNSCNLHGQEAPTPEMIRPPREPRGRLFVVTVRFFTRRGWTADYEIRVRSGGLAGAIWKGAIAFHLDGLKAEGIPLPKPSSSSSYVEVPA